MVEPRVGPRELKKLTLSSPTVITVGSLPGALIVP